MLALVLQTAARATSADESATAPAWEETLGGPPYDGPWRGLIVDPQKVPALPDVFTETDAVDGPTLPPAEAESPPSPQQSPIPPTYRTRHAKFQRVSFEQLPAWHSDRVSDAWPAFTQSCRALGNRRGWAVLCNRARAVDGSDDTSVRSFFEHEFAVFQIREPNNATTSTVTGYHEPLLVGTRVRRPPYVFPVYRVPSDLVVLDSRRLPRPRHDGFFSVRIEGRTVVPAATTDHVNAKNVFAVHTRHVRADARDRRVRLRAVGRTLVPYSSRSEIESGAVRNADVIAWVSDPAALYWMQIQGSGRIRLVEGGTIRVGYAEQNGHPFIPGLSFLGYPSTAPTVHHAEGSIASAEPHAGGVPHPVRARNTDPSYVFFRVVADHPAGPIGSLGVPVTAGRSIAVDPRTAPLGVPVYLSTTHPASREQLNRLMLAQDTGGALRGALRADSSGASDRAPQGTQHR